MNMHQLSYLGAAYLLLSLPGKATSSLSSATHGSSVTSRSSVIHQDPSYGFHDFFLCEFVGILGASLYL